MRAVAGALTVAGLLGCNSSVGTPTSSPISPRTSPSTPAPHNTLPVPADFREACRLEASVCSGDFATSGPFPSALERPLVLPAAAAGQSCPVSGQHPLVTSAFGGVALGS